MGRDQNLCESSMNVIPRVTICGNRKWQFSLFYVILSENWQMFVCLHEKLLTLQELGVNRISQFRTDVKHDSVKC